MRNRVGGSVVALLLLVGTAPADPPKPAGVGLRTVTYDVADLLRKPGHTGYARIEDVVKLIVTTVDPEAWDTAGDSTLEEVNGTPLRVTTGPGRHALIAELLAATRRKIDLRVDFKSELYEVERKVYEKEFKDKLKDGRACVVENGVVGDLQTRGTRLKEATAHAGDGETAALLSARRAFTYVERPAVPGKPAVHGAGLAGLRVTAAPTVSADRRFVRLKLTHRVTELVAIKKHTVSDPDTDKDAEVEAPDLAESSATVNVTVGDGEALLVPVALGDGKDRERVRLLLVRPTITIEEEEKERKKGAP